jgi:hypothetical protein
MTDQSHVAHESGSGATLARAGLPPESSTPIRVCRRCSTQAEVAGDFCPHCGASYLKSSSPAFLRRKGVRLLLGITLGVVILGGGTSAVLVKVHRDNVAKAARAAATQELKRQQVAAQAHAEAEAEVEAAKKAKEDSQREVRQELIKDLEGTILKDAKKDVKNGLLDGPILRASCTPVGGGSTDDLTALTGSFSCIAVTKEESDGTASGYAFAATINWSDFSYTWHLGH